MSGIDYAGTFAHISFYINPKSYKEIRNQSGAQRYERKIYEIDPDSGSLHTHFVAYIGANAKTVFFNKRYQRIKCIHLE
jgi:hypothetical protein